jgi:hypothetical protein
MLPRGFHLPNDPRIPGISHTDDIRYVNKVVPEVTSFCITKPAEYSRIPVYTCHWVANILIEAGLDGGLIPTKELLIYDMEFRRKIRWSMRQLMTAELGSIAASSDSSFEVLPFPNRHDYRDVFMYRLRDCPILAFDKIWDAVLNDLAGGIRVCGRHFLCGSDDEIKGLERKGPRLCRLNGKKIHQMKVSLACI